MKTVKITVDNKVSIIDIDLDDFRSIQEEIGGYAETVSTRRTYNYFDAPVVMLVDEEGILKNLPINILGSWLYACEEYGDPIVGDIILAIRDFEYLKGFSEPEKIVQKLFNDFHWLELA